MSKVSIAFIWVVQTTLHKFFKELFWIRKHGCLFPKNSASELQYHLQPVQRCGTIFGIKQPCFFIPIPPKYYLFVERCSVLVSGIGSGLVLTKPPLRVFHMVWGFCQKTNPDPIPELCTSLLNCWQNIISRDL